MFYFLFKKDVDVDCSFLFFINKKFVFFVVIFCCLLWGSVYLVIKNGYVLFYIVVDDILSKMVFVGYCFLLVGLVLLFFVVVSGKVIGCFKKS